MRQKLGVLSAIFLIIALLLSACTNSSAAPYVDRSQKAASKASDKTSGDSKTETTESTTETSTEPTTEPTTEETTEETTTEPEPEICSRAAFAKLLYALPDKLDAGKAENPFEDVAKDDDGYDAILYVYGSGLMKGASSTKFKPDGEMTRSQVITVLHKLYGKPEPVDSENPFKDITAEDKFYAPVMWALQQGMLDVPADANFLPNDPCTVEQVEEWIAHLPEFPEPEETTAAEKDDNK